MSGGDDKNLPRQKRTFRAEDCFLAPWVSNGPAAGVFFPKVVPELEHSKLVKVSSMEAVLQLMPQGIEGWDKEAIGLSLQLLSKLTAQVPCYHLKLCPNVAELPRLIEQGLEGR